MAEPGEINAGFSVSDARVTVEPPEHADERTARLGNERRSALIADIKDIFTYFISACILVGIGTLSVYTIFLDDNAAPETRLFAVDALKILTPGVFSFFLGRAIGAK